MWARCNTGQIYYQHQQTPNQIDPINQLHIRLPYFVWEQALLNTYLHRIKKEHPGSKVCLLPRQWWDRWLFPITLPTPTSGPDCFQLNQQYTTRYNIYGTTTQLQLTAIYNISTMNRHDTDRIVRSLGLQWGTKKGKVCKQRGQQTERLQDSM